jgi:hypothetical protein
MIRDRFLPLLLLGLLSVGLASVALPEEMTAGPHAYDGDEDDAAVAVLDGADVYLQRHDVELPPCSRVHGTRVPLASR